MTSERLRAITGAYGKLRLAVAGDFCLDRYLEIDPARAEISIETGLPVHNVVRVRAQPGGAGTVMNNLAALGVGELFPVGWCGDDGEGYELRRGLAALPGLNLAHFFIEPERRTYTYCKPLLMDAASAPRELSRLDSKNWTPTPASVEAKTIHSLETLAASVDGMILLEQVDQAETGVITRAVLKSVSQLSTRLPNLRIVGDSRRGLQHWPPITLKMNAAEFANLVGRPGTFAMDEVKTLAAQLAGRQQRDVIITLAERGLIGASAAGDVLHQPALAVRGPIDIVGAGDSVTANLTAALAAGASLGESLMLASLASSIVIHKLGTTGTASPAELEALLRMPSSADFANSIPAAS